LIELVVALAIISAMIRAEAGPTHCRRPAARRYRRLRARRGETPRGGIKMHWTQKWTLSLALVGVLAGCGSGEPPQPKTTPIGTEKTPIGNLTPGEGRGSSPLAGKNPPVIRRIDLRPSRPTPGNIITADVDVFDPDGDEVALSYTWAVDGSRVGDDQATLLLREAPKDSTVQVTVIARDRDSKSPAATVTARIANRPPKMLGVVIEPLDEVRANRDIAANPRAQDPDGDPLEYRYRWRVDGDEADADGPVLSADHYRRGDQIELTVVAHDGEESSEPLTSAPFTVANSPPRVTSTPGAFDEDGTFRYAVRADDPDGDRNLRYTLVTGPDGMDLDIVSGELTWTPTLDQAGSHPVAIEVGDRKGGVTTQSFDIRVEFEELAAPAAPAT
jgi:hypothetical protein